MIIVDAIKARLPLISLSTRDLVNFKDVLKFLTGKPVTSWTPETTLKPGSVHYLVLSEKKLPNTDKIYAQFAKAEATLVVMNSPGKISEAFDAGELFAPTEMVRKTLCDAYDTDEDPEMAKFVEQLLPTLGGLTLKEVAEVIRLTEAIHDDVSPQGVTRTRALLVPDMQGFSAVSTMMEGPYIPNEELADYAVGNKKLFLNKDTDPRLVPKGVLFDGLSGTGKTQGAKWLADRWGVPLYRLDPSIMDKYYGESEKNLKKIFAKVAQEAPCILLLDEVEKLFGNSNGENNPMSGRLLGMLLWQMQESRDRVFYVMTSNRKEILPPELIREGRIDTVLVFQGLAENEAQDFALTILRSFIEEPDKVALKKTKDTVASLFGELDKVSHSSVTAAVKKVVKATLSMEAD